MLDPHTRRALVFLRYGIGDVVMELPALAALREALPHARITAVGAFPAVQLLEGTSAVDEVRDLRAWGLTHRWDDGSPNQLRAFVEWFAEHEFDLVLDVHHAPPCLAYTVWGMGVRTLEAIEEVEAAAVREGASGVVAVGRAVREGWGLEVAPGANPRLRPPPVHQRSAVEFLQALGLSGRTPFAVSPVASHELKRWPLEKLAEVVNALTAWWDDPILVFCGPQEDLGEALRSRVERPERLHLVGSLHLLTVASLLARCRASLSNDTGLMHIAAAVGTPTIGVFGPTKASIYRPPGSHVLSVEPEMPVCPFRETRSLHPPGCFAAGRCLVAPAGCIVSTPVATVIERLHELLVSTEEAPMSLRRA